VRQAPDPAAVVQKPAIKPVDDEHLNAVEVGDLATRNRDLETGEQLRAKPLVLDGARDIS